MMWWRVVLDKDGSIKSCDQVEASEKGSATIVFIRANSKVEACVDAKEWLLHKQDLTKQRWEREKQHKSGTALCSVCSCKRIAEGGRSLCRYHLDLARLRAARSKRERGRNTSISASIPVSEEALAVFGSGRRPKRYASPEEQRAAFMKANTEAQARSRLLRIQLTTVLEKFDELGARRFRLWLVCEIQERTAKAQGKSEDSEAQAAE